MVPIYFRCLIPHPLLSYFFTAPSTVSLPSPHIPQGIINLVPPSRPSWWQSTSRPIPTEILAIIFAQLACKDLYQCLFVSHYWHEAAEAQLYSEVTLDPFYEGSKQVLFPALSARRHLIRKVKWGTDTDFKWGTDTEARDFLQEDLLDILFDYRPPAGDIIDSDALVALRSPSLSASTTTERGFLGPNRLSLSHFTCILRSLDEVLLDLVLFNLPPVSLTTLDLIICHSLSDKVYLVDVERILETYRSLKHLGLYGQKSRYMTKGQVHKDHGPGSRQTGSAIQQQHSLESFTFEPRLLSREGPDAFTFFERFGNLKRIQIRSSVLYHRYVVNCQPWDLGRALKEFCPKLESIHINDPVLFWFFDLPILPYDKIPHITSLVHQSPPEDRLRQRLQEQERKELLDGKTAAPFFPHLKKLILGYSHFLAAQDLLSLGAQAQFLTHLELYPSFSDTKPWEVYDKDDEYAISTTMSPILSESSPAAKAMIENRRLQKRRPFNDRDLVLFLQACSSLRYLNLTGCNITFESLIDGYITAPTSGSATTATSRTEARVPYIRPWACADRLETLEIALDVPYNLPKKHHAVVWKHLGRLRRLRSLALMLTKKQRFMLVPSFDYGVEYLFQGGGMGETLEKLRLPTNWLLACEGHEMVLCLAQWCPHLRDLGLEWKYNLGGCRTRIRPDSFLKDEKVKQCSIRRIVVHHGNISNDDEVDSDFF